MKPNIRVIRNWLNTIFILGALVGMYLYYVGQREMGGYIILISILIKFTESSLRMMNRNNEDQ